MKIAARATRTPRYPKYYTRSTRPTRALRYPNYNTRPKPPELDGMELSAHEIAHRIRMGLNIGDTLEAYGGKTEIWWDNPRLKPSFFRCIKEQGFDAVRLPISWNQYTEALTARIDDGWLKRVTEVVEYCLASDLFVVINVHWDGGWIDDHVNTESAATVIPRLTAIWQQIATTLRDFDQRLLFTGMNEPKVDSAEQMAVLMQYHQAFVDAVRATGGRNAFRTLVLPGPTTDIAKAVQWFDRLPVDSAPDRLMLDVHYYTPWNFTGLKTDEEWGRSFFYWGQQNHCAAEPDRNATWGEEEAMAKLFADIVAKARTLGVPMLLGEYSARNRIYEEDPGSLKPKDIDRHLASLAHYVESVTRQARLHDIAPFYWDNGALIDRRFCMVREGKILAALQRGASDQLVTPSASL